MNYILVFLLGILASAKMGFQSSFGKESVKNSTDALVFNIFIFVSASIMFLPRVFGCSPAVWLYAAAGAVFAVAYQLIYTKALTIGNVSLTVLIVNFSMVINVVASYLLFDEDVSCIRLVAIVITVISFIICNGAGRKDKGDAKWLTFTLLAMIFSSCGSVVQKFFGASVYRGENQSFVSCLYICSAVIGLVVYPIMQKKEKISFRVNFSMVKYAVAAGVSLALYQMIYTYGLANIDGTFLFPAITGGTIIFSTLLGVLVFKDRFTKRQITGIVLGLISLVMMSY